MDRSAHPRWKCLAAVAFLNLLLLLAAGRALAGGVTIITHGFDGNVTGWVTSMADKIPAYRSFPGTNFTTYTLTVTHSSGSYFFSSSRVNGSAPTATDSGEIIVKLDWSSLASAVFPIYSTSDIGFATSQALLQTNLFPELGGHALVEYPLHLAGHSRGGSLMSEISRDLGTNGLWIDQLTTLDPHPLNNDGFSDPVIGSDAPVHTYANVLFHDNYWENIDNSVFDPNGEPVSGAYIRQLTSLPGGYTGSSSNHSNVHLWYHGTIDPATPTSDTDGGTLTGTERTNWWTAVENQGLTAGFQWTLIGGSNRLSTLQPVGPGYPAIRDGFNQMWDLGAGVTANRTSLPSNSGGWPNLIRFDRLDTNAVAQGQTASVSLYYQWAQPATNLATLSIYLDNDFNPLNGNGVLLKQLPLPGTGAGAVGYTTATLTLDATNAALGTHALYAVISGGGRSRLLYAPELLQVVTARPVLDIARVSAGAFQIGVNGVAGQTVILQSSTNLQNWLPVATNHLATSRWTWTNSPPAGVQQYFQAVLGQ